MRPQRRPPCPRHPIVGVCYRGGLRLGRRAAPRRDLTDSKRGNCTIRGTTRRRHAEGRLLMLQNPPSSPGCGGVAEVNCVPESPASQNIWAITPMLAIVRRGGLRLGRHIPANSDLTTRGVTSLTVNGGNCTIRGATRRQNPPNAAKPPPLPLVSCSLAGAGLPGGRHTTPNRGLTATKRGELHH